MKSLDLGKVLKCLDLPWGTVLNPGEAMKAVAAAFAGEALAKFVHLRLSRRPVSVLPAVPNWTLLSGEFGPDTGVKVGEVVDALSDELRGANGGEAMAFRKWDGPRSIKGIKLGPEECLVLFAIPFHDWVGCALVIRNKAGGERDHAEVYWAAQLSAMLTSLVEHFNRYLASDLSMKERREFYEKLSAVAASRPTTDIPRLCDIWREHSGADWVWLWMHNDTAKQWELVGCSPTGAAEYIPDSLITPTQNCVAEYCNRVGRHEFIEDPENWRAREEKSGEEFRVVLGRLLKEKGCVALDCVPLIQPPSNAAEPATSVPLRIRGAVCLYYRDVRTRTRQPSSVYLLMGRLSASMITDSYEAEQRRVLFSLNNLTEEHLTAAKSRPAELRAKYLKKLRLLISTHLNVKYVSLFWKDAFQNRLVCLETSGLWRSGGGQVPAGSISEVKYGLNEGITGKVFASGKAHLSQIGGTVGHKPTFTEIGPGLDETKVSWIVCPIPFLTGGQSAQGRGPVSGVIRCVENEAVISPGRARDFDPIQLEALSFITRQIAPVLEAMAANIFRELSVSVIKHDLFAPIRMIKDTVEGIERDLKEGRKPEEYAISDLTTSLFMAEQLVRQLDAEPTNIRELDQKPTMLEGDIIARIKAMLRHYAKHEAGMEIVFGDFRGFPALKVDRTLIERVLHNLIVNAIKYGKEGTEIRVMPLLKRDGVVVAVSNYGLGVEPAEVPHLFTENYRSPRAQQRSHGLGLGLKIARAAMRAHGGDLVLSQAKEPTIFSMIFPREVITNQ
jgi:signal transduction histidine kinase